MGKTKSRITKRSEIVNKAKEKKLILSKRKESDINMIHKIEKTKEYLDEVISYTPFQFKPTGLFERVKRWWLVRRNKTKLILIRMDLVNGKSTSFLIPQNEGAFVYKNNLYVLDEDMKKEDIDSGYYYYQFHEKFSLPFRIEFPINDYNSYLLSVSEVDYEYSTNPSLLRQWQDSKIIEKIMKAEELGDMIQRMFIVAILTLVGIVITIGLILYSSGALDNII